MLMAGLSSGAMAHEFEYHAVLTGSSVVPANASPATGFVHVTTDLDLVTMQVQAVFSGLTSPVTSAAISTPWAPISGSPARSAAGLPSRGMTWRFWVRWAATCGRPGRGPRGQRATVRAQSRDESFHRLVERPGTVVGRGAQRPDQRVLGTEGLHGDHAPLATLHVPGQLVQTRAGQVRQFSEGGETRCTRHPHPFFGSLTPQAWSRGMYKHLDHHLRQFGV